MNTFRKQWFSISIIICLIAAYLISNSVSALDETASKYLKNIFILLIFLLSGLTIETFKLIDSIKKWQAHLFIQSVSFILFPLIVVSLSYALDLTGSSSPVYVGFVVLACIPTTISSCVVFTSNAGGNRECALFNATVGNLLGIVLTPMLIFLLLSKNVEIDAAQAVKKLLLLVLLPFVIGQIMHNGFAVRINPAFAKLAGNWLMLGIMLITFINAFDGGMNLISVDIAVIVLLCLALHMFMLAAIWYASGKLDALFTLADRKCITITASQKTVALGLPVTVILFAENPNLALISLPVIAYHTIQLFVDGIVVEMMAEME